MWLCERVCAGVRECGCLGLYTDEDDDDRDSSNKFVFVKYIYTTQVDTRPVYMYSNYTHKIQKEAKQQQPADRYRIKLTAFNCPMIRSA